MARSTVSDSFRVYYITCESTGMGYVGITSWSLERRFKRHLLNAKCKRQGALYNAMREHGPVAFSIELLETVVSWDEACSRERTLIDELETKIPLGYNATGGGDGNYGYEYTDKVRARMSASAKLKCMTPEHLEKIAASNRSRAYDPAIAAAVGKANLGRKAPQDERDARSARLKGKAPTQMIVANIGSKRTPEQRAHMSAGMTGVKRSAESCANLATAAVARNARAAEAGRPYTPPLFTGKTHSDETRARMSATNKARWALRKAKQATAATKLVAQ